MLDSRSLLGTTLLVVQIPEKLLELSDWHSSFDFSQYVSMPSMNRKLYLFHPNVNVLFLLDMCTSLDPPVKF